MIIVDTTVWIDYLRGMETAEADWLDHELGRQPFALTDLIFCEILQGIRDDADFETIRRHFQQFQIFATGGAALAVRAAQNYRWLRQKGLTVRKTIDCWIATFCIEQGHALLHRDRDFDAFERHLDLRVIHP